MKSTMHEKVKSICWLDVVAKLVIIGAFVVVIMIALLSECGAHPDEGDAKLCLDWGMTHWIWPDMREEGLGDTYSWYGYTKACNYTPYFLIAGKIAYVFKQIMHVLPYYRVPNLLLMLIIVYSMLKNLKDKKYLLLAFGVCAQAWYIFAYVTADAMDFVWAFIAILLLVNKESMLWDTVNTGNDKNIIRNCIILGLLYGMMLLGKPYYYATMFLTFVILVIHLVKSSFSDRVILWKRYLLIVFVCVLVFTARVGVDFYHYGTEKTQVKAEMFEIYASDDKKEGAEITEYNATYHMADKGYTIPDLFRFDNKWMLKSYRSYVSARVTEEGDEWFYIIMGVMYLGIYGWIAYEILRASKKYERKEDKKDNILILVICTLLIVGSVVASIMNSYLIDSQSQGRYLLPIALTMCYLGSRVPKLWNNKIFYGLVVATGCLSVMYFGLFDSRKLIDLGYVRSMLG